MRFAAVLAASMLVQIAGGLLVASLWPLGPRPEIFALGFALGVGWTFALGAIARGRRRRRLDHPGRGAERTRRVVIREPDSETPAAPAAILDR